MTPKNETSTETTSLFGTWGLSAEVMKSISEMGFKDPTPVQEACIPHLLQNSGDLLALARTGTGKTAAFGIPLVEKLTVTPELQALVLCPTRELATQVAQALQAMGKNKGLKVVTILGGESYRKQIDALRNNPQILVSTPGRLIDLMDQKVVKLKTVRHLILDEADEMLSFGFQEALETIWENLGEQTYSTWLFSATMSDSIRRLTNKHLDKPYQVSLNTSVEPSRVKSYASVTFEEDKEEALCLLLKSTPEFYGIIFAQTKKQVAELEIRFRAMGLKVDSLHGDKVQADRTRVIQRMKKKEVQILVATDVAARGLDIEDLTHVVNYEIPWDTETYTHRIGRTARAGKAGIVWTLVKPKEAHSLRKFERALKFEFEKLVIPSIDQVRKAQVKNWITSLSGIKVHEKEQDFFKGVALDLQVDGAADMSPETQEWMFKVLKMMKIGAEFSGHQPRSFDLRPKADQPRFEDRQRPSGIAHSRDRNDRGGFRGGGPRGFRSNDRYADRAPRRDDRSDDNRGDDNSSGPRDERRDDRPASAPPARSFAPRRDAGSEGRPRRTFSRSGDGGSRPTSSGGGRSPSGGRGFSSSRSEARPSFK